MAAEVPVNIPQGVEQLLANISDAFVTLDSNWRYTFVNNKLVELAGKNKEDFLGRSIWELFPDVVNSQVYTELHRAVAQKIPVHFEYLYPKWHRWLENHVYPLENGVLILTKDITQSKRKQQLLAAQCAVTRILAEATTFTNAVPTILQSLCESLAWQAGIIWSINDQANALHYIDSWFSSSLNREDFPECNQYTVLVPGQGLAGQVWENDQPVWIKELSEQDNLGLEREKHAAIAFPMRLGSRILGVIAFYSDYIPEPESDLLEMLTAIATQIGQFMEQQRTELLLRTREEKYRGIFETAGVAIREEDFTLVKDFIDNLQAQGITELRQYLSDRPDLLQSAINLVKIKDVNQQTLKMFGAQTKDELFTSLPNIFVPETSQVFLEELLALAEGRHYLESETIVKTLQGEHRHILLTVTFPPQETGYDHVVVSILDITERQHIEENLRYSEARYRSLAEASAAIVWTAAPWGNVVEDIPTWQAFTGQTPEQYKAWGWVNALHPEDRAAMVATWKQAFPTHSIAVAEYRVQRYDGEYRHMNIRGVPIIDDDTGEIREWVGMCLDITERKQAEAEREQLLEREQLARIEAQTILESITDGFMAFDRNWCFTYLNQEGSRTLGRSLEDLRGKNVWEEFPELADTSFGQLYQKAVLERIPLELEDYYPPFDAWFIVRAYPSSTGLSLYFRNINVRKQSEAALRESEARFRLLAENSTDIISRQTVDGRLLYVSPACYTVLGYQPEELVGRPSAELVHPEDLAEIVKNYAINVNLSDIYTITHRAAHKNGSYIWLEATVRAIRDRQTHEIIEIQASSRDITERKQVEDRQRFLAEASGILASSLDYEITFTSLAQLIVPEIADWCIVDITDENQLVRRVAAAHAEPTKQELVEQLKNYPPDLGQLQGAAETLRSGKSQITHQITAKQMQAAASNASHLKILQELNPQTGMSVPLIVRGQVIGAITLVSSFGRRYGTNTRMLVEELARRAAVAVDNARLYTEAQRSQQAALRAASRTTRLQAITAALSESLTPAQVAEVIVEQGMAALGASSALVALVTASGKELEIVRSVGYQEELVNAWRRFSINTAAPLAEAVRTGEPVWQEPTSTRVARYSHLAQIYAQYEYGAWISIPLMIEGRAVGGMSLAFSETQEFNQDDRAFVLALTQQCAQAMERARLYEAEQIAREAAETANRIKDEFLAVLSHELRSPLNPILGWAKLLQSQKVDQKTIPQALKTIERNALLQAQLIEDLLDISRILQGKLRLNIYPVDLASVILAALETVRLSAQAKLIEIQTTLEPNLGQVLGDSSRLQQIIWNLLSNAVKFTPEGGQVEIRLQRVVETGDKANKPGVLPMPYAQITVTDTGKGIDPNFLPFVFEYFRQENSTTTRKFGGLGLGLAIARHLVELHGGTIQVASQGENQGATFTVQLPLKQDLSQSEQETGESQLGANLNSVKILVVDDDTDTRELVVFLLENYGAKVTAVASADEALIILSNSLPDVVLSDIGMPEVDGCMFMRQVRQLPPEQGGKIPAIALTAYAGEMNQKQVLAAGFHKHIAKPVEPEELVQAIVNLIQPAP